MSYISFLYTHFIQEKSVRCKKLAHSCRVAKMQKQGSKAWLPSSKACVFCHCIELQLLEMGLPLATMSTAHRNTATDFQKGTTPSMAAVFQSPITA